MDIILRGQFEQITWIFSPGHAGVVGIDNNLTLDHHNSSPVYQDHFALSRTQASSHTLTLLKEKGVQAREPTPAEEQ